MSEKIFFAARVSKSQDTLLDFGIFGYYESFEEAEMEVTKSGKLELTEWEKLDASTSIMNIPNNQWVVALIVSKIDKPAGLGSSYEGWQKRIAENT